MNGNINYYINAQIQILKMLVLYRQLQFEPVPSGYVTANISPAWQEMSDG